MPKTPTPEYKRGDKVIVVHSPYDHIKNGQWGIVRDVIKNYRGSKRTLIYLFNTEYPFRPGELKMEKPYEAPT